MLQGLLVFVHGHFLQYRFGKGKGQGRKTCIQDRQYHAHDTECEAGSVNGGIRLLLPLWFPFSLVVSNLSRGHMKSIVSVHEPFSIQDDTA